MNVDAYPGNEFFYIFHESIFVETYIVILFIISLVIYFVLRNSTNAYLFVIILCSYSMMGWSLVPALIERGDHYWFFTADPPGSVSRVILFLFVLFSILESLKHENRFLKLTLIAVFCITVAVVLYLSGGSLSEGLAYSILFSSFLALTAFVAALPNEKSYKPLFHFHLLLVAVIGLGFWEFAMDLGPIRNFFRDSIETRALSTFHNPNWFALSIAPAWFLAMRWAIGGNLIRAVYLASIVNLGFIISGSRSVHSVLMTCCFIGALWLLYVSRDRWQTLRNMFAIFAGSLLLSSVLGVIAASLLGAGDRFGRLLVRLYLWPVYTFSDNAALESIVGRSSIRDGVVIDNSYLYAYSSGVISFLACILILVLYVFLLIRAGVGQHHEANIIRYSAGAFVVFIGLIGQVYWAFPVWPVVAVLAGCTLRRSCFA